MNSQNTVLDYLGLMDSFWKQNITWAFSNFSKLINIWFFLDVLIVSIVFYSLFMFFKGTKAFNILIGIIILGILAVLSQFLNLIAFAWLLRSTIVLLIIAIPIVFQPELRNALEQLGRTPFDGKQLLSTPLKLTYNSWLVNEIVQGCLLLVKNKFGALIVFEKQTGLKNFIKTGILINADLSGLFLSFVFNPKSPFHDGAIIIQQNKIKAVRCTLPLTEKQTPSIGLRHKAALGITEQSDCLVILISEEKKEIYKVSAGKISEALTEEKLRRTIRALYPENTTPFSFHKLKQSFINHFQKRGKNKV